jgi:hypothetical protein
MLANVSYRIASRVPGHLSRCLDRIARPNAALLVGNDLALRPADCPTVSVKFYRCRKQPFANFLIESAAAPSHGGLDLPRSKKRFEHCCTVCHGPGSFRNVQDRCGSKSVNEIRSKLFH